ncbi:radical SAM protein [Candidatus Woesearchaeota archaeon]|nr:radical SAM protein [Candidatus Woesearchaeota archaeon]
MLQKLKYIFSVLKNTYSYTNSINEYFLDYYLRHHKIIGWHNGLPVYSSFLTPGLSKPLGNHLARRMISDLIDKPLPGVVHIGVTDICNARCEHCSFYNAMDQPGEKVLTTEQMKKVIKDCQDFGISIIHFVGGEPLLRKDLCELIKFIDKDKSVASIFTNGWLLKDKAKSLKEAGTMMVNVSIDSTKADIHDKFRRLPGLFDKAIEGLKECQKVGLLTGISTTLTQEDLLNGNFEKMILFAKEMKVNELLVFDTMPIGMYSHREDLSKKKTDRKKLFSLVDKYNHEKDSPGIFCYAHFRDQSVFGCSAGRNFFYVTPYGEICPCDFTARPVGNILNESLPSIWFKLEEARQNLPEKYANECCNQEPMLITMGNKLNK